MSRRALIIMLAVALAIAVSVTLNRRANPPAFELLESPSGSIGAALPRLWQLPDFSLTERSGRPVTQEELRGHIWLADFFYTSCPGPCLTLTGRFGQLQKQFAEEADLRFVSISSEPEKDTPEVLKTYAARFQAGSRWLFLTGEKKAVYDLANKGFKLSLVEDPDNAAEPIVHSLKFVLIDRAGWVRGVYDGLTEEGKEKLVRDLRLLLAEKGSQQ